MHFCHADFACFAFCALWVKCPVFFGIPNVTHQGPFPLRAWKRAFFVSFINRRLKRAQKKSIKQTKNALFHARSGNGPSFIILS